MSATVQPSCTTGVHAALLAVPSEIASARSARTLWPTACMSDGVEVPVCR
jgi:hypothetical protein